MKDTIKKLITSTGIVNDELIIANLLSNLLFSFSYPSVHCTLIKAVDEKMISINSIVICIAGMTFPMMWNRYSERLYKKFGYMLTTEGILYIILTAAFITGFVTTKAYYIIDTLLYAVISKNILCGCNKLRVLRYKGNERETYDNNSNIIANFSSLIGFVLSSIIALDFYMSFVIMCFGAIVDNIFYYKAYKNTQIS